MPARSTPLRTLTQLARTPLRQVSPKRAAELVAAGRAPVPQQRVRYTGPDRPTVTLILLRDHASCAWCADLIHGVRGQDWSVSHRRPRRMGGDRRPDTNSPANLCLVHGHALSACHGRIEGSHRSEAKDRGHVLSASAVPSLVPIDHAVHGWVLLDNHGGWRAVAA